jgi:hypothetical protein
MFQPNLKTAAADKRAGRGCTQELEGQQGALDGRPTPHMPMGHGKAMGKVRCRLPKLTPQLAKHFRAETETGMTRLALSDSDKHARDWFVKTTEDLGCKVTVDEMGNVFAVRPGLKNDKPPTFAGSHLDTQPTGGRYDGILGVHAGIEMLKVLNENWIETEYPVGVVNWTKYDILFPGRLRRNMSCQANLPPAKKVPGSPCPCPPPASGLAPFPSPPRTIYAKYIQAQQPWPKNCLASAT